MSLSASVLERARVLIPRWTGGRVLDAFVPFEHLRPVGAGGKVRVVLLVLIFLFPLAGLERLVHHGVAQWLAAVAALGQ